MEKTLETTLEVNERSQIAQVRRAVAAMAAAQELSEAEIGRAELVATEACSNLVKYGRGGIVALSRFGEWGVSGVQIIALDRGPGIADIGAASRDGHSTGGGLGLGLGVIKRASDVFDAYTGLSQGSAFLSRIVKDAAVPDIPVGALATGARSTPKLGQTECGDAWATADAGRWQRLCVVDGLGHGPQAAVASARAIGVFSAASEHDSPRDILERAHEALKSTRGAVMAVVAVDTAARMLCFSGVGNIAGLVQSGDEAHYLMSVEGVVGYNAAGFRLQELPWNGNCAVILSSDGLAMRRNLARHPGLQQRHPALIAAVLHRDFGSDADDATVLVATGSR